MSLSCDTEIVLVGTNSDNHNSLECEDLKLIYLPVGASFERKRRTKLTKGSRTPSKVGDVVVVAVVLPLHGKML